MYLKQLKNIREEDKRNLETIVKTLRNNSIFKITICGDVLERKDYEEINIFFTGHVATLKYKLDNTIKELKKKHKVKILEKYKKIDCSKILSGVSYGYRFSIGNTKVDLLYSKDNSDINKTLSTYLEKTIPNLI